MHSTHLHSLVARGGIDGPEDLLGALSMVGTQLQWESRIKYLVIMTDAPAHGQECNDDPNDRYRSGDPNGLTMKQVMEPLVQKKYRPHLLPDNENQHEKDGGYYGKILRQLPNRRTTKHDDNPD